MGQTIPKLATTGEVANLLGASVHRIEYVLRTRPHIKPRATAARLRCFDDAGIELIQRELSTIDARRQEAIGA